MLAQSSHQLEEIEDVCEPQFSTFGHMLEEQMPGVRGDLVPLQWAIFGVERLHLGGELAGYLWRDFERLSFEHDPEISIPGRLGESVGDERRDVAEHHPTCLTLRAPLSSS